MSDTYDIQGFFEAISNCETQTFFDSISHRIKDFNPRTRKCCISGCYSVILSFGFRGGEKIVCVKHKDLLMGDVICLKKVCRFKECTKSGTVGIGKYKFCAEHVKLVKKLGLPKTSTIKKGWSPKCRHKGCNITPSFDKKTKCKEHSVEFANRICISPGCGGRHPRFGLEGGKANYCRYHGLELGMVDLYGGFCVHYGCKTRASFKKHKYAPSKYCSKHSPSNYGLHISVCEHQDCMSQPTFGRKGSYETTYCENHKPSDYVHIRNHSSRCIHSGCKISATFGFEGKKRIWCFEHKKDGCVNLTRYRKELHKDTDIDIIN